MALTYGEEILERAEAHRRFKRARKRRLTLLVPATVATLWALADLIAARHARLSEIDATTMRFFIDHVEVLAWTLAFVLLPLTLAVKPDPIPSGAALAILAGPLTSPMLFGSGGWKWWQLMTVVLICGLILSAARTRRTLATARA